MSLVWEHYPAGGGELLTALALADHAHDDGSGVRPSIAYTATKTRQSERTIQNHTAEMRRTTWLLTVRNAGGGRGRATEYRINPGWITNPAGFAPFLEASQSVQRDTGKGAVGDSNGRKAFAPQPSTTVSEPTTTAATAQTSMVSALTDDGLRIPSLLTGEYLASTLRCLRGCPAEARQAVLDEIAALDDRSAVRSPLGLLASLVSSAARGKFVPSAALQAARAHRERSERHEQQARLVAEADRRSQPTAEEREAIKQKLLALRANLTKRRP